MVGSVNDTSSTVWLECVSLGKRAEHKTDRSGFQNVGNFVDFDKDHVNLDTDYVD